ncbi:putative 50S ribosomal protein L13, chloroplastic-like isoform X1 [Capsicum annuum]|nr:putative 50S ribosomal protein L13, chloroplastic-like isoform X1 [Capsicum annuum]
MRQFPLVCLKVAGNDFMIDIEGYMKAKKGNMMLRSVVFSETLLKEVGVGKNNESMLDKADSENDVGQGDCIGTSKDAMKALVNAPMLIDLNLWLHWDMVFAPSLGSLVGWLLNEVEFCHFAADILLSGVQPFVKDAPLAILDECERIDQRLMLHRVGMSLGIVEWVEDKHKLSVCSDTNSLMSSRSSCLKVAEFDFSKNSNFTEEVSSECPLSRTEISFSQDPMRQHENQDASCSAGVVACVSSDNFADSAKQHSCELESSAASVIESIQREEFGLQPDLSPVESAVLNKQHARLGRALDCLSQELYSQDSHFILELICILTFCNICLVQNADDNTYLEHVEPTLTFILQYKGIIVLNNERGFSADNIRALCDVGNSTKKGRNAGYIGKKGIGFKSVFRVTDAPEIHSSGFHIKFDISEGQIGFVLPTVVPPCDIDSYTRLASLDSDCNHGNTCIVLPFRSSLLETSAVENIVSMFSDLHPSLLLFLHGLHCIIFRNMLSDSTFLMRKEVVGNGIVKEALDGTYNAHLTQQPVFAFLPLRKYGLKFILQGDFVLPSSREEVDGDSPWNQWWLSEFPGLFVSAERSFCDLLCFKDNPAKGVTAYMSFVPLVGEVHGFFSGLPWMILSKLRMSNCLIIESTETEWVLPCKTLRNWTQEARNLLPDSFLHKHLGVGFLHKDIVLTDLLARALGIEEYGLKVLFQVITSLCTSVEGLHEFGMVMCVDVYMMLSHGKSSAGFETEMDLMKNLKKIPFIPLSDGKYGSLDEGAIWLHVDQMGAATNDEYAPETFPRLYSMLRTVSPTLLSDAAALGTSCSDSSMLDNITRMLYRVGVQRLSAHQIVKMHILPFICRDDVGQGPRELLTEYYAFLMFHLQSSCPDCQSEKDQIIREVEKNISDVCSVPINATLDGGLNSRGSVARDWMSDEFVDLLSQLSSTGDKEKCKYLLEVLDSLWDDYFADKVTGFYFSSNGERQLFGSSFTRTLRDVQWLASSLDSKLHCPRKLFHGCDTVRLLFGDNAPYAIPEVRSNKLLTALGLKIQVTVDDTLAILKAWRAELTLSASLSQMSKFYNFIWSKMNTSERKVVEELRNERFVFVPCKLVASHEDVVPGVLLSFKEVFWRDLTGSTDQVKMIFPESDPHSVQHPFTKMLCSVYPSLHDFFVKECGVNEFPHFHGYLQILLQLSATALPSQAAKNVFEIFLKWIDELNSGSLGSEDIGFLKQGLLTTDYLVLPTAEDKWIVTREVIYYGPTDSSFVVSVVNWILPYAQRYIYKSHPDKYLLLSQSGFENLKCL